MNEICTRIMEVPYVCVCFFKICERRLKMYLKIKPLSKVALKWTESRNACFQNIWYRPAILFLKKSVGSCVDAFSSFFIKSRKSSKWLVISIEWLAISIEWMVIGIEWLVISIEWSVIGIEWSVNSIEWLVISISFAGFRSFAFLISSLYNKILHKSDNVHQS